MNFKIFPIIFVSFILGLPGVLLAEDRPPFTPIVGIPGVTDPSLNFSDYINALYALAISIAAIMAVIKIIIAGVKYMLSDVVTSKSEALSDIQGAIFGLIIVISSYLILYVINPQLIKMEVFMTKVVPVAVPPPPSPPEPIPKTGSGYRSVEASPNNGQAFQTSCTADKGRFLTKPNPSDGNKPYHYCLLPLGSDEASWVESSFPGRNITEIKSKYQEVFPREVDVSTDLGEIPQEKVLFVAEYKDPGDWIDFNLSNSVDYLCDQLDAVNQNKKDVDMEKVKVGDKTYYACVEDD